MRDAISECVTDTDSLLFGHVFAHFGTIAAYAIRTFHFGSIQYLPFARTVSAQTAPIRSQMRPFHLGIYREVVLDWPAYRQMKMCI